LLSHVTRSVRRFLREAAGVCVLGGGLKSPVFVQQFAGGLRRCAGETDQGMSSGAAALDAERAVSLDGHAHLVAGA
jgi:hypothetical protein